MADLSKQNQRRIAQDSITNNRDAILPTRREDRVADVRVTADLRNATRVDRQTEEVRRVLGMVQNTADAYYKNDIAKRTETAKDTYAQGTLDASAGREMDPAQAQAVAYQRAYYSVTASARQTKFETETTEGLEDLINKGGTPEDIDAYIGERAKGFIEETSDLFVDRDVQFQVGSRLSRWANETDAKATAVLKDKTDREMVNLTVSETQAAVARGEAFSLQDTVERLRATGLDGEVVQDALVNGLVAYANETGDTAVLQNMLDERSAEDVAAAVEEARGRGDVAAITGTDLPPVTAPAAAPAPAPEATNASTYTAPLANMGNVSSGMGARRAPLPGASTNHGGIDLPVPVGTPVSAPADGVVTVAGNRGRGGNTVIIRHADGTTTGYAHLSTISVKEGDTVTQGQQFAASGNTGNSTGPHLHFSARNAKGERIDPRSLIGTPAQNAASAQAPATGETAVAEASMEAARRPRVPGRSLLNPAQQVRVLAAIEGVEADSERKTEKARVEAKDALTLDLWTRANAGEDVSETIEQAVRDQTLEPGEGMTMSNAFRSLRNSTLDGEANEDLVLNYAERFAVGQPNYAAISAQADRDYNAGRFGTGRNATRAWVDIKTRAANGGRADRAMAPEERATVSNARSYVSGSLGAVITTNGSQADPRFLRLKAQGENEFETRLARGESPMQAADAVVTNYTKFLMNSGASGTTTTGGGNTRAPGGTNTGNGATVTRVDRNGIIIQGG